MNAVLTFSFLLSFLTLSNAADAGSLVFHVPQEAEKLKGEKSPVSKNKEQERSPDAAKDESDEEIEQEEAPNAGGGFLEIPDVNNSDSNAVTEVSFGCVQDKLPIYLYISPSCFHCAEQLIKKNPKYLQMYGATHRLVVRFLPTSAKDLFIMKLIYNRAKAIAKRDTSRIPYEFYYVFVSYIKHMNQIIRSIKPTEEQISMFKGSNTDPDMIKFQIGATMPSTEKLCKDPDEDHAIPAFEPFTNDEVVAAMPNLDAKFEAKIMDFYRDSVEYISAVVKSKELTLPLITRNDKSYKTLEEASSNEDDPGGDTPIATPLGTALAQDSSNRDHLASEAS